MLPNSSINSRSTGDGSFEWLMILLRTVMKNASPEDWRTVGFSLDVEAVK
jgi:hypothetical protein